MLSPHDWSNDWIVVRAARDVAKPGIGDMRFARLQESHVLTNWHLKMHNLRFTTHIPTRQAHGGVGLSCCCRQLLAGSRRNEKEAVAVQQYSSMLDPRAFSTVGVSGQIRPCRSMLTMSWIWGGASDYRRRRSDARLDAALGCADSHLQPPETLRTHRSLVATCDLDEHAVCRLSA